MTTGPTSPQPSPGPGRVSTIDKVHVNEARARASRIRAGIASYLSTLADVAKAYQERDWITLGYADWQEYVDTEFSESRLRLSPEHRQKAVNELRLTGMSQRAIGSAVGVSRETVRRDLSGDTNVSPEAVTGTDGKTYPAAQPSPVAEAMHAAIGDAVERNRQRAEHNAWVREVNEGIPPETKAYVDDLGRRISPVTAISLGCEMFLDAVKDIDPDLAVAQAPEQLMHKLAVVHDALAFLSRVADALKPKEVAA